MNEVTTESINIEIGPAKALNGYFNLPEKPIGIILFSHGSGSSSQSPRNQYVAMKLNEVGLATLLIDLLTRKEEMLDQVSGQYRFDIPLLAERLLLSMTWLGKHAPIEMLPVGLFGASTGSASAIIAAAKKPDIVQAVVSRGGRPDLAGLSLSLLKAPTLLIVGGNDFPVIDLNRQAMSKMRCEHELKIIPGATHLFEEQGALEKVAELASSWFLQHFAPPAAQDASRYARTR